MIPGKRINSDEKLIRSIASFARLGKTMEEIAELTGISKGTLYLWFKKNDDLLNAVKNAKEVADSMVENALLKKAIGFKGDDNKFYAPDTTAQMFWLQNRQPEKWRDRRNVHVSGNIDMTLKLPKPVQMRELIKEDVTEVELIEGEVLE